ncbi:conserved membrane family protein [Mycobacterium intracellulare]|nr:conserved membrane family protein [Mycobacterium intracellulare]
MLGILKRAWIPLVIVAVAAVGGFVAYRLQGVFGSHRVAEVGPVEQIVPINVKRVVYEVTGPRARRVWSITWTRTLSLSAQVSPPCRGHTP